MSVPCAECGLAERGEEYYSTAGGVACEEAEETVPITLPLHPQPTPLTLSHVSSCSPCLAAGKRNRGRWVLGSIRASNFMLVFGWGRKS